MLDGVSTNWWRGQFASGAAHPYPHKGTRARTAVVCCHFTAVGWRKSANNPDRFSLYRVLMWCGTETTNFPAAALGGRSRMRDDWRELP